METAAFQAGVPPHCRKKSGPRQGKNTRVCIVHRERLPRTLMFRVTRTKDSTTGKQTVQLASGHGRSAYVCKDVASVQEAIRKRRIAKALRCHVPHDVELELQRRAEEWEVLNNDDKGLLYCEAYGLDGVPTSIEHVQEPCDEAWSHDIVDDYTYRYD